MAKPVSNRIMTYGRKHPFFRNKILIPAGRANEKHTVSHDDLNEIVEKIEERFEILQKEIENLKKNEKDVGWFSWRNNERKASSLPPQRPLETEKLTISRSEAMKRLADYDKIAE
uniref:Uncharacterized protein n=1 Tax=Meloidogyne floridensis TaxID=298350 RepID=A0A915P6A0_9BILA